MIANDFDQDGQRTAPVRPAAPVATPQDDAPFLGTLPDSRRSAAIVPDKDFKSAKSLASYFGVSSASLMVMVRDEKVRRIAATVASITLATDGKYPRSETISSLVAATDPVKYITVTTGAAKVKYNTSLQAMTWGIHKIANLLFTGPDATWSDNGIPRQLWVFRAWLLLRFALRDMGMIARKELNRIASLRSKQEPREDHYTKSLRGKSTKKPRPNVQPQPQQDVEIQQEEERLAEEEEKRLRSLCVTQEDSDYTSSPGPDESDDESSNEAVASVLNSFKPAPAPTSKKATVEDAEDESEDDIKDGYSTDEDDPNARLVERRKTTAGSTRVKIPRPSGTRDEKNPRWRWFTNGKVHGGEHIQDWYQTYQEVDWIDKNAPNPSFDPSLLNGGKGRSHKREGVRHVFEEHAAQTLPDFGKDTNDKVADTPDGNVAATPDVNAADTPADNAADTPADNAADTPADNAADTPADNVEDTPAEPTDSLPAALTHGPNGANFFASKHDAKVLKDMYNDIQALVQSKDKSRLEEFNILMSKYQEVKKATDDRTARRQLIWLALNTNAESARADLLARCTEKSNIVSQIASARFVEAADLVPEQPTETEADRAETADQEFRSIDAHDETFHHNIEVLKKVASQSQFQPADYQAALTYLNVKKRSDPTIPGMRKGRFSLPWQTLGAAHFAKRRAARVAWAETREEIAKRKESFDALGKEVLEMLEHIDELEKGIADSFSNEVDCYADPPDDASPELLEVLAEIALVRHAIQEKEEERNDLRPGPIEQRHATEKPQAAGSMLLDEVGIGKTDTSLSAWLHVSKPSLMPGAPPFCYW
jgi:hypothetical protein